MNLFKNLVNKLLVHSYFPLWFCYLRVGAHKQCTCGCQSRTWRPFSFYHVAPRLRTQQQRDLKLLHLLTGSCLFLSYIHCSYFWGRVYCFETVSLCSPGSPRTHCIDQISLILSDLSASASRVLHILLVSPSFCFLPF